MPGPMPKAQARRRNQPTIPTTSLPASGRTAPAPEIPSGYDFGVQGLAWWQWAWTTPQAAAWSDGNSYVVARRASLEDDVAALSRVEGLDFDRLLEVEEKEIRSVVSIIASLATGRVALMREMRELDDRLGLTPKSMAALRWTIVADTPEAKSSGSKGSNAASAYSRLRAV